MAKKRKKKGGVRIFGITSRVLMLIVAGLLVLSYGSMLVNPAKAWGFSLIGLMFVPLSLVNLFLLLWTLKRLSRSFAIPLPLSVMRIKEIPPSLISTISSTSFEELLLI